MTDNLVRVIGVLTTSDYKIKEIRNWFQLYGIEVVKLDPTSDYLNYLRSSTVKFKVMAVIREQTYLYHRQTQTLALQTQLELVDHVSKMKVYTWNSTENDISLTEFIDSTLGYIDLTRRNSTQSQYDWDDIFVVDNYCHQTYVDLATLNLKISSRDKNISKVIEKHVHYKKHTDLIHNPQKYTETIDFSHNVLDYITSVPEYNTTEMSQLKLKNIIITAYNQGFIFRASKTRREKLYWYPGLNSFVPFTPKPKDAKHELTYQVHDLTHFNIPDLVYDGQGCNITQQSLRKKVYITYRLISESITLVLGDMMFVHMLMQNGFEYKTVNQRRIYPIFTQIAKNNPNFTDLEQYEPFIHKLLLGSFQYCFYRDTTIWTEMMGNTPDQSILNEFSHKYDAYFMDDFKWTQHNYEDMMTHPQMFANWWAKVQHWRQSGHQLELQSITEFIEQYHLDLMTDQKQLLKTIFEAVYETYIKRLFVAPNDLSLFTPEQRLRNGFIRYLMGQSVVCFQHSQFPDSMPVFNQLNQIIVKDSNQLDLAMITNLREFYHNYLQKLEHANLITPDDRINYNQIYPLFNPLIVGYDKGQVLTEEFVNNILN